MLVLHILSFGFVVGVTAIAEKDALLWFRGKKQTLDEKVMHTYHVLIWAGLITLVGTGLYLFYPMRIFLLQNLLFDAKLLFVAILIVNAILIGRLMHSAQTRPFASLAMNEKLPLFLSGAISVFSWFAAFLLAIWVF